MRFRNFLRKEAPSLESRLLKWRVTDKETGCWNWGLSTYSNGYGKIKIGGRSFGVHRVAMHVWRGFDLDSREQVNHEVCDNPRCFNPDHLKVGDQKHNIATMLKRDRRPHHYKTREDK